MSRSFIVLMAFIAVIGGAIAMVLLNPAGNMLPGTANQMSESSVRQIVEQMLAERDSQATSAEGQQGPLATAKISAEEINPLIENYLMGDPKILQRVSNALQAQLRAEELASAQLSLAMFEKEIYEDPGDAVLGNPDGDITLVEFFDYNCVYCRRAMPDIAKLLDEDPNLRVVFKEFPILSEDSIDAARVSVVMANTEGANYWEFHQLLFTTRGQIGGESAYSAAEQVGMSRVALELDVQSEATTATIQRVYALAQELNITGTPAFIIGDEIVAGAVGYDVLREKLDNVRECGSTSC